MGRERERGWVSGNRRYSVIKAVKAVAVMLLMMMPAAVTAEVSAGVEPLETLTVSLTVGDGKLILAPQTPVPSYTFMYKSTLEDDANNKPEVNSTASSIDWMAYEEETDISGANGTPVFVQVIQIENGTKIIRAWGQASATPAFVSVTRITDIVIAVTIAEGTDLILVGTVEPANATNRTIVWTVKDAGETGAEIIDDNRLKTTEVGTVVLTATIANGATASTDYTQDFTITISRPVVVVNVVYPTVTVTRSEKILSDGESVTYVLKANAETTDDGTLTYQWFVNNKYGPDGASAILGATGTEFSTPYDKNGTLYYYVVVTNKIADNGDGGRKSAAASSAVQEIIIDIDRRLSDIRFISPKSNKADGVPPNDSIAAANTSSYTVQITVVDQVGIPFTGASAQTINLSIRVGGASTSRIMRTDPATGIARFDASLAGSNVGNTVTFTARAALSGVTEPVVDTASLRIVQQVSVLADNRRLPGDLRDGAFEMNPLTVTAGEFIAGPNVVSRGETVKIFRVGKYVSSAMFMVYDASGNLVSRIKMKDSAVGSQSKRVVGFWDLKDTKGRVVSEGTYLIKGTAVTSDGKREKISLMIGVR